MPDGDGAIGERDPANWEERGELMDAWEKAAVLALITIAAVASRRWMENAEREGRRRALRGRESLPLTALYARYYSGSGMPAGFVKQNWREIGVELEVDPGLLRPEDRLCDLVGVPKWLGTDGFNRVEWLVGRVENLLRSGDAADFEIDTLDDMIRLLWRCGRTLVRYEN